MNNLLTSILSKITTGPSSFYTDISGRVYLDRAPDDVVFPYCIILIISDIPDNVFDKEGEEVTIQFSLFSESSSIAELSTMYTDLKTLFDDVKLTVTSNTMFIMQREALSTFIEDIVTETAMQKVRHWAVDYVTYLQAS